MRIQDLVDYCGDGLTYDSMGRSRAYNVRKFEGDAQDKAVVDAYVDALCNGGYNQALVEDYEKNQSSTFFRWGLNYTGTGDVTAKTGVIYTDTEATIHIYGIIKRGDLDVSV